MPAESDWVLHSPYPDKALIRNAFTYSLGRDIGMAAPRGVLVEVYVNTPQVGRSAAGTIRASTCSSSRSRTKRIA